jgi:hypothetical protein
MTKRWLIRTTHGREVAVQADTEATALVAFIAAHSRELLPSEVPAEMVQIDPADQDDC